MGIYRRIMPLCLAACAALACIGYAHYTAHDSGVQSPDPPALSVDELEYISNLGTEKYNHLLDVWREDGAYSPTQDITYPSFYGGCYEDDNKDFVIMVTSLDQEVINYFEDLIDLDHVRFSLAENSYQELLDGKAVINQLLHSVAFGETIGNLFTGTGISEKENAVNIYVATEDIDSIRGTIEEIYAANSDRPCKLRFVSAWLDFP